MTEYENRTLEIFNTTAIYPNRIIQKRLVERLYDKLVESGSSDLIIRTSNINLCIGYIRIVYGDHGPYFEFLKENILFDNWQLTRKNIGYYNKYYAVDGSGIMLYEQLKSVINLKNPPKGKYSYNGNRKDGYADYRIGRFYISVLDEKIMFGDINTQIKLME